jgi:heptosyltransferase-1
MQRILLIKTTSLGDVIHCLPAVSEAAARFPGARIDWVIEEPYAGIVALHPGVYRALPVAMRRWRRSLTTRATWDEIGAFRRGLDPAGYDRVIDAQGLLKSALLARLAKGERHGLDPKSAREGLASYACAHRHKVPWTLDAVARNRLLLGQALGYTPKGDPEYAIKVAPATFDWLPHRPYCVLLSGTADGAKLWPEERWLELGRVAAQAGYTCLLPHGSRGEEDRAKRIAISLHQSGVVVPRLPLTDIAGVLAGAVLVVGLDSGLTHLAAALGRPTVGIYCGSHPADTGVVGRAAASVGDVARTPDAEAVWVAALALLNAAQADPTTALPAR